jgi:hypothetical protein
MEPLMSKSNDGVRQNTAGAASSVTAVANKYKTLVGNAMSAVGGVGLEWALQQEGCI